MKDENDVSTAGIFETHLNQLEANIMQLKQQMGAHFDPRAEWALRQRLRAVKRSGQEMHEEIQQLQALIDTSALLTSSLRLEEVLEGVMDTIIEITQAERGYVMLCEDDRLSIRAARNWDRETLPPGDAEFSRNVVSQVVEKQEPILTLNAQEDQRFLASESIQALDLRSIVCVPLQLQGQVIGIIYADNRISKGAFNDVLLPLLTAFANQVAVVIENARLFGQLEQANRTLEDKVAQRTVELEQAIQEAEQARAAAEEANRAKSAFLATVSHELRTPLTSVLGFSKIIKKRLKETILPLVPHGESKVERACRQVRKNIEIIITEGERLTELINNVLDLAKIESGKVEWNMEPLSVPAVMEQAVAATSSLVASKPVALQMHVHNPLPTVVGDRDRLIQVMVNLISNAIKFTEEGTISCTANQMGDKVTISVTDTGVGIDPTDYDKVFEQFVQVKNTLTSTVKGTGLGLPISKHIVEYHGGRIWVESEPGHGSTFTFTLPASQETGF